MSKMSFRFYKDHEVRAIWDEENSKWWFSVVDIVGAITDSPNPRKYWSVLKSRLKKAENELTTRCSQLKMIAADGKRYATDCFAQDDIIQIVIDYSYYYEQEEYFEKSTYSNYSAL